MQYEKDLIKDIRTYTSNDDTDYCLYPINPTWETDSYCNLFNLDLYFKKNKSCKSILEIGVNPEGNSFTNYFINNKSKDSIYVGIDVGDRSHINNKENNVYTMQNDSSNYNEIVNYINDLGIISFDFIFIDGWHSINQVLKDWEYSKLLSDDGIIGMHDVSHHPGPKAFLESINTEIWNTSGNLCPKDWGIAFFWINKL